MGAIDVNSAIQMIKQVGSSRVRAVPMPDQNVMDGNYQIEVKEDSGWRPIVTGIKKRIAEDIITQATNRVILG
jgi:hypothetical protein